MEHLIAKASVSLSSKSGAGSCNFFKRLTAKITPGTLNTLRDCSTILAFTICLIILAFYTYDYVINDEGVLNIGPYIDP